MVSSNLAIKWVICYPRSVLYNLRLLVTTDMLLAAMARAARMG